MKIDRHTLVSEFSPFVRFVDEEAMERVRKAAVRDKFGEAGFYGMTVGDFTTVIAGDPRPLYDSGGRTVFDNCRVDAFKAFIDELAATLKRMKLPPTADSVRMTSGTIPVEFVESIYLFCRNYFNLPSYDKADALKVSEYLMARKDDYNRQVIDRNVAQSMKKGGKA